MTGTADAASWPDCQRGCVLDWRQPTPAGGHVDAGSWPSGGGCGFVEHVNGRPTGGLEKREAVDGGRRPGSELRESLDEGRISGT